MRRERWNRFGAIWPVLGSCLVVLASSAAAGPVANFSRTLVSFSFVPPFAHIVQPVFVTNTGDAPLNVSAISLTGVNSADFTFGGTCVAPIALPAGGGRCRIDVATNLAMSGPLGRAATLTVQSDAFPAAATIGVSAIADDAAPYVSLLSPSWIDFPPQPVGTSAPQQTFTFTNSVDVALRLDNAFSYLGDSTDFVVTTDCATVESGASCTITIGFRPTAAGPRSTELEIDYRAPSVSLTNVYTRRYSVTGVGTNGSVPGGLNIDQQGLTGSWYQAATSGQGIELEVFKDFVAAGTGFLQGSWFTFDAAASGGGDHNRWYTFGGNVVAGASSATLPLYQNVGGNFNAPPVTSAMQVGQVTISFGDCATALFDYTFTDGSNRSGTEPLTRLTPNVLCATAGSMTGPSDFGLSGNWFDPAQIGQGLVFEVNPVARVVFLAWYTYAVGGQSQGAAGQRWYTAQATYAPGARTIPVLLYETTGGLLNRATPAPTTTQVGTGTLAFSSCIAARLAYAFTGGSNTGQSGSIDLVRVGPMPESCAF
jgi:hypothetical protein